MLLSDMLVLAFRNLKAGKKSVSKIVFGLSFAIMITVCIISVKTSFQNYVDEFNEKHLSSCFYFTNYSQEEISNINLDLLYKKGIDFKQKSNASEVLTFCELFIKNQNIKQDASSFRLYIDNEEYKMSNYSVSILEKYESIVLPQSTIFMGLYKENLNIFRKEQSSSAIICGSYPKNQGEILVDNYFIERFHIDNAKELIGKKISIAFETQDEMFFCFKDYVLTGIFDSDLLDYRENVDVISPRYTHIYANIKNEDMNKFNIDGNIRCYFDNYLDYFNSYGDNSNLLKLNISELNEVKENEVQLSASGLYFCLLYWMMTKIGILLMIIFFVIILIIIMSIMYTIRFYKDRNSKYFSMLFSIGMEKKDRRKIFIFEFTFMVILASIFGTYCAVILLNLLNAATTLALDFSIIYNVGSIFISNIMIWIAFTICNCFVIEKSRKNKEKII